jgi:hypothetical protein
MEEEVIPTAFTIGQQQGTPHTCASAYMVFFVVYYLPTTWRKKSSPLRLTSIGQQQGTLIYARLYVVF